MLKNLNELAIKLQTKYNKEFDSNEILLSEEFKEAYGIFLRDISQDIAYTQHTAMITSSGNLKMYIPNQWFRAAAFMVPYVIEIIQYKRMSDEILSEYFGSVKEKKTFYSEMKNTNDEDAIENLKTWISDYCDSNDLLDEKEFLIEQLSTFITNYNWWFGSKTIDRGDYYVSPVLALLGVVNSSQSYIADISYYLATHDELGTVSEGMLNMRLEEEEVEGESYALSGLLELNVERKKGGINEIVYGAPGTGKSRYLADKYKSAPLTRRVVFHSEYSYYDFIGLYKPIPIYKESDEDFKTIDGQKFTNGEPYIDYCFTPGPFTRVLVEAWLDPSKMHTLLIEEINRADAAAVFGEIFQLLDRDIDGKSEYSFEPSQDLKNYLKSIEGMEQYIERGVFIPSNMNIVATMNSADQGVRPMDSAFKRRWNFHYMKIDIKGAVHENAKIRYAGRNCYWGKLISIINQKLSGGTIQLEEDKLIGPYFIRPEEIGKKKAIDKLLLYLWDDVLRHYRDSFFNNEIKTFVNLLEKFEEEDVLDVIHPPYDVDMFISELETIDEDENVDE
jgi:GTPase subunit of restriction endonuclease